MDPSPAVARHDGRPELGLGGAQGVAQDEVEAAAGRGPQARVHLPQRGGVGKEDPAAGHRHAPRRHAQPQPLHHKLPRNNPLSRAAAGRHTYKTVKDAIHQAQPVRSTRPSRSVPPGPAGPFHQAQPVRSTRPSRSVPPGLAGIV